MDPARLLDLATALGYRLAMSGAETYRVEESINRVLEAYGLIVSAFVIPNCMTVSIRTEDGHVLTRMRRIGQHGNDLDAVERYSNLSRQICRETPSPEAFRALLNEADRQRRYYRLPMYLMSNALGAFGFAFLFGGSWTDALCSAFCGIIVGLVNKLMERLDANQFFRIIAAAFSMAVPGYALGALGIAGNADAVIIGALMILVPGLLITNAMRDIIYGDTNSGMNRIVQVLLIAIAIALGTAAAWNVSAGIWGIPTPAPGISYGLLLECAASFVACVGFAILFNIHGPGMLLCGLGGLLTWLTYALVFRFSGNDLSGYFFATVLAAVYSEVMARVRKYPAISYLVISIFPLIPGAGVYYTMNYAVRGQTDLFMQQGMHTAAIAGVMAVAILLVSTVVRMIFSNRKKR